MTFCQCMVYLQVRVHLRLGKKSLLSTEAYKCSLMHLYAFVIICRSTICTVSSICYRMPCLFIACSVVRDRVTLVSYFFNLLIALHVLFS